MIFYPSRLHDFALVFAIDDDNARRAYELAAPSLVAAAVFAGGIWRRPGNTRGNNRNPARVEAYLAEHPDALAAILETPAWLEHMDALLAGEIDKRTAGSEKGDRFGGFVLALTNLNGYHQGSPPLAELTSLVAAMGTGGS